MPASAGTLGVAADTATRSGRSAPKVVEGLFRCPSWPRAPGERTGEQRTTRDKNGVDWSALKGSPPEAMAGTMAWLRSEHGSIDGFLDGALVASGACVGGLEPWRRQLFDAVRRPA